MTPGPAVPVLGLVRAWALDWLSTRRLDACLQAMSEEYSLLIGGFTLAPRAEYIEATQRQLFDRFPDLTVTVHDAIYCDTSAAVVFSEHGGDARTGSPAAWKGVALFDSDGHRLLRCFAEEDYFGRRRQLSQGRPDRVGPPAIDPWGAQMGLPNPVAERVVTDWLMSGCSWHAAIHCDDAPAGGTWPSLVDVTDVVMNRIFSADSAVAFHATLNGTYTGDLADGLPVGSPLSMAVAGLVRVEDGSIAGGHLVRDRLGVSRLAT